jgi:hypothetical protein
MNLVTFLAPIRISTGDADQNSVKYNYGIKGLEHTLNNILEKSSWKNMVDGYKFNISLKIDECDDLANEWIYDGYEKYKSYVMYNITPRIPSALTEPPSNLSRMHYTHCNYWYQDCYDIAPVSRYYWIWNQCNEIMSADWDQVLHDYNGLRDKVLSGTYPTRAGGCLFPIVPKELVDENIKEGLTTPIVGTSPADIYWEQKGWYGSSVDIQINGDVKL